MLYRNEYTREISFPIGGIGTGCFGIAGNGEFVDWEIFNHPDKGRLLRYTHIAVKAEYKGNRIVKILQGDHIKDLTGTYRQSLFCGFGFGPDSGTLCGLPHFEEVTFDGAFPIATLTFRDPDFPGEVILTALSPFIPLDSENSSLPVGLFKIEFQNTTDSDIRYSAIFSLANPFEGGSNRELRCADSPCLFLESPISTDPDDVSYGNLTLATRSPDTELQTHWYRGNWSDHIDVFMHELQTADKLPPRSYPTPRENGTDIGSVASHVRVAPKAAGRLDFVLSWYVPRMRNTWCSKLDPTPWHNYYATRYASSAEVAAYCLANFESLTARTEKFRELLHTSTLDPAVIDAASSTLAVLRSPTVYRLEDGSFYGFEGVNEKVGSCEGTCQHVWNYAYALCFLFPDLERSIRNNEFTYCTEANGRTHFRMQLPRGRNEDFRACLDGQMGCVIKTFREWRLSGDNEWLRRVWETVKPILSYAWSEENPDKWDLDRDGVLEGRQHHTLDLELFGPSAWLQGLYLAALRAGEEMAAFLGDTDFAATCRDLFEKGYTFTRDHLFNGEYFIQQIDLSDRSICEKFDCTADYWYDEGKQLKYQIGNGCEIDQLLGQWHADLCGLGDLFDQKQMHLALQSLMRCNFKPAMRKFCNTWRVFSLNDEGGAVMCEFPHERPIIPLSYYAETMTGFEYALAGLMISRGMEAEGLTLVRAIRDRYDGKKRNPWNEIECGSNYARAMASFALLPLFCRLSVDLPHHKIGFAPLRREDFACFFSVGSAWGQLIWNTERVGIELAEGELTLCELEIPAKARQLLIDGLAQTFTQSETGLKFEGRTIRKNLTVLL